VRRVAIIASASGNGKTTLGRQIAARLGVRFVELDALVHGPSWTETPDDGAFWGRESLFGYALLQQRVRRRDWPAALAAHPVVRLRSPAAVDEWLANIALPARHHARGHVQADRDPGARRGRGGGLRRR
jgi:Shikimate kinase